mgnify:CR=1 FL=1
MSIFTSFQPSGSGSLQLGNLLGALMPFKNMASKISNKDIFLSVASLHSTTQQFSPNDLKKSRIEMLASFHACGLYDIPNISIFDQCDNNHITEISQLISHIASLGPLEVMTQFKDKGRSNSRDEVPFGLLSYPILMTADILSLQSSIIPVGIDQHQHLQFAKSLIKRINKRFGCEFILPNSYIHNSPKIMDLKFIDKKMSKSRPEGAIFLDDSLDVVSKKIKKATTDNDLIPSTVSELETRPACKNLITMYSSIRNISLQESCDIFSGKGYGVLKGSIIESYEEIITPISNKLADSRKFIIEQPLDVIFPNFDKVLSISESVKNKLKDSMGLGSIK